MKHRIAIEPNLTPIKDYLTDKGYQVESINLNKETAKAAEMNKYDAYVVTGLNSNFMGIENTNTKAVVIKVEGMTPEQVYHELQMRLD